MSWRNPGPRPTNVPPADGVEADPAKGEAVPRCYTCGAPGHPKNKLLDFDLSLRGKPAGGYRLCEKDWLAANPPGPVDPLHVEEAA